MKRWEPIKTEKKQLGGIIKLLQKVSPKLVSKAKGRLLVSRLRQVKDLKTPYIFPGQLGWSPAETRTVWHRTNNPNFKIKRVFEGRWDAKEHGAPKNGLWVSEKKDIGFMNDRPILIQLQQILKKPMVQIGDIPAQGKNKLRNHILREAEQSGADAVKFQGIKDNKASNQNVTFIFDPTASTAMPLKNQSFLDSPEYHQLQLQRIWEEVDSGRKFLREYLKSPKWGERASKHMSRQEAYNLGNFESQLLSSHNPPEGFKPLYPRLELLNNGAAGQSVMPYKSKQSYREIQIDPNNVVAPRYTGVHESAHASNLNYTPFNGYKHYKELFPEELQPLLDKQLANAKKLADQLEIDPKRYKESVDFVAQNRNISTQDAKDLIDNWILYLKDPGEVRARGLAAVAYSRTMHTKDIPKEVDGGQGIFTKESLDNLYRNIFSIGAPIGVGLYATQN